MIFIQCYYLVSRYWIFIFHSNYVYFLLLLYYEAGQVWYLWGQGFRAGRSPMSALSFCVKFANWCSHVLFISNSCILFNVLGILEGAQCIIWNLLTKFEPSVTYILCFFWKVGACFLPLYAFSLRLHSCHKGWPPLPSWILRLLK